MSLVVPVFFHIYSTLTTICGYSDWCTSDQWRLCLNIPSVSNVHLKSVGNTLYQRRSTDLIIYPSLKHIFTMHHQHVLITSSKLSPCAACSHLQNVHPRHIFTAGPCTLSMYLSLAASFHLWQHVLTCRTLHPRHIFTAGPCTVSMYLSLAASAQLWQQILNCRMCILSLYSPL